MGYAALPPFTPATFLRVDAALRPGKLRDECLNEEVFASLAEARAAIELWRRDYNHVRPHSALGGLTPDIVRLNPAAGWLRGCGAAPPGRSRRRPRSAMKGEDSPMTGGPKGGRSPRMAVRRHLRAIVADDAFGAPLRLDEVLELTEARLSSITVEQGLCVAMHPCTKSRI